MGSFIYRDYSGIKIADYTRKTRLRNLWIQLAEKKVVDGVEVYRKEAIPFFIRGKGILSKKNDGRDDADPQTIHRNKLYRFLRALGTKDKDLKKSKFKKLEKAYISISRKRFSVNTYDMTKADIATKLQELISCYQIAPTTTPNVIELPTKSNPGDYLGSVITTNPDYTYRYTFDLNGAESVVTPDSNFVMQPDGSVFFTLEGKVAGVDVYTFDTLLAFENTFTYTVRAYKQDGTYITFPVTVNNVIREFDISHRYAPNNGMMIEGNPQSFAALLPIIDAEKVQYYGNVRINGKFAAYIKKTLDIKLNVGDGYIFTPLIFTNADVKYGNVIEALAAIDDGTTFQNVGYSNIYEFITDVSDNDEELNSNTPPIYVPTVNWTTTYKRVADVTETSYLVEQIYQLYTLMKKSARKEDKLDNDEFDTLVKEAVAELMDVDLDISSMFYGSYLRVDAVEGVKDVNGNWITPPMSVHTFFDLLTNGIKMGYVEDDGDFWDKVIAIVIVVIAVVIAVVVYVFTGDLSLALICAQIWMTAASMVYAKHIGSTWGMKLIGRAIEINGIAMTVVGVVNAAQAAYTAVSDAVATEAAKAAATTAAEQAAIQETQNYFIMEAVKQTVIAGANAAALGAYMGVDMGGFGEFFKYAAMGANLAEGLGDMASSISSGYQTSMSEGISKAASEFSLAPLKETAFRDVSKALSLLKQGVDIYAAVNSNGVETPNGTEMDQGEKESDGVNPQYALRERITAFDALESMQGLIDNSNGLYRTELLLAKNTSF